MGVTVTKLNGVFARFYVPVLTGWRDIYISNMVYRFPHISGWTVIKAEGGWCDTYHKIVKEDIEIVEIILPFGASQAVVKGYVESLAEQMLDETSEDAILYEINGTRLLMERK